MKSQFLSIRLSPETRRQLEALSNSSFRSMSDTIGYLIDQEFKKNLIPTGPIDTSEDFLYSNSLKS